MKIAIIADDLTGASDAGVQLVRAGYRTAVAFPDARYPAPAGDLDAVAFDTDSRTSPAGNAAQKAARAGRAARGARLVYKKLDSTLRGAVAAELLAALESTGRERALVAPAFPAAGRTTVGGVQLVRGVPVHETEAKDDPRTPVRIGHVPTLLAGVFPSVRLLSAGDSADPAVVRGALRGARCVVADAASDGDLLNLARAVPDPEVVLWAGSAGLARALGEAYPGPSAGRDATAPAVPGAPLGRVLVVVGSLSGVAREQLRRLVEGRKDGAGTATGTAMGAVAVPVASGSAGAVGGAIRSARGALSRGACAVLHTSGKRRPRGSGPVVTPLARVVQALSREGLFDAMVLTGGSTAFGVARRLGAAGFRLSGEVEAGVPVGTLIGPSPYPVVTKAGGFGDGDTLVRAVEKLQGNGRTG